MKIVIIYTRLTFYQGKMLKNDADHSFAYDESHLKEPKKLKNCYIPSMTNV